MLTLERKYGDSLNHEDLYGFKQRKKRKPRVGADGAAIDDGATEVLSDGKTLTRAGASELGQSKTELSTGSRLVAFATGGDDHDDSEDEEDIPVKRNPDTVSKNPTFDKSMRARSMGSR